jgi:hypothetical protein
MWLLGLRVLAVFVLWFVVAPLNGYPVAGAFVPVRMPVRAAISGVWVTGVGLTLLRLVGRRTTAPA